MSVGAFSSASSVNKALVARVAREVDEVEHVLEQQVGSQVKLVRDVASHTLRAGGKRLRPALVALAASATGLEYDPARAHLLGACMELIHMATLIHDDVIDHADTRRGVRTAAAVFGNTAAILSGDVMLSKAMAILAEDGDIEIIRTVSKSVVDLAEGEVAELEVRGVFDLTKEKHYEILHLKTATFIQTCCRVGAMLAGADKPTCEALSEYGYRIGLAFQLADDLLDYRGDHAVTGKAVATDFQEGCATMPLLCLLPKLSPAEFEQTQAKFGTECSEDDIRMLCQWMDTRGAFAEAEEAARHEVRLAEKALCDLPESEESAMLQVLAELIVTRQG
ncbi:MAG: polyprenyl synthetase family protein [Fimbriimonadaceae bacterium]|nr:polyprenyl synthetase family protein [Fimbriimonadaceae bacterium]